MQRTGVYTESITEQVRAWLLLLPGELMSEQRGGGSVGLIGNCGGLGCPNLHTHIDVRRHVDSICMFYK